MAVPKTSDHIQIKIKMANPIPEPSASTKVHNQDLKNIDVLSHSKSRQRAKIWIIGIPKTVTISESRSSCETSVRNLQCPVPNQDLKDMGVLCTF